MRAAGLLGGLFIIGLILIISGFEGQFGAVLAAIVEPAALVVSPHA